MRFAGLSVRSTRTPLVCILQLYLQDQIIAKLSYLILNTESPTPEVVILQAFIYKFRMHVCQCFKLDMSANTVRELSGWSRIASFTLRIVHLWLCYLKYGECLQDALILRRLLTFHTQNKTYQDDLPDTLAKCPHIIESGSIAVKLFSKLNRMFIGCFDPEHILWPDQ